MLLGQDGEPVRGGVVPDVVLDKVGAVAMNAALAGAGRPPLPAVPDLMCILERGPQDGRHVFLPFGPPESLSFARPEQVAGRRVPPSGWDRYELTGQPCGHGRTCPYEYRWVGVGGPGGWLP